MISNKVYNVLKWVALIAIPAFETFYWSIGNIWGFPYVEQIVGTMSAVGTLLGALIGVSTVMYNKAKSDLETKEN